MWIWKLTANDRHFFQETQIFESVDKSWDY